MRIHPQLTIAGSPWRSRQVSSFTSIDSVPEPNSIGIVTTFYFQTLPAPPSTVNWAYIFNITSPSVAATAFSHIQDFAQNVSVIDDKIGFGVTLYAPSAYRVTGSYRGDEAVFRTKVILSHILDRWYRVIALNTEQIAPELLRGLPTPIETTIKSSDWLTFLADQWGSPLAQPLSGYNASDNFYAKSILVPESKPLTVCARSPFIPSHHLQTYMTV